MFGSISELFWLSELHRSFLACRSESLVKHKRVVLFWTSLCFQRVSSLILAQYRSYPISWSQHHSYFRHFEFIHLCWSCVKYKGQMHPRALQIDFEKKPLWLVTEKRHVSGHLYLSFYLNLQQQQLRQIKCIHSHLLWNSSW